uniref:Peptidase A2 domain-containing protein n=1 Tax=Mycena chlorophos TaxID=658473 RepID=A0ABQ0KW73_MYCCL|nr:predicted protein [Mycena chlorophos]
MACWVQILRLGRAEKHIRRQLLTVKRALTNTDDPDLSSVNSTISGVRHAFENLSGEEKIWHLAARKDYALGMVDAPDRDGEIQDGIEAFLNAGKEFNRFPYRSKETVPVMREPSPGRQSAPETAALTAPTNAPSALPAPHVHWAPDPVVPAAPYASQTLARPEPPLLRSRPLPLYLLKDFRTGESDFQTAAVFLAATAVFLAVTAALLVATAALLAAAATILAAAMAALLAAMATLGYWQFNTKLPVTFLPEFEGDDDKVIDYLGTMDRLARSSPYMFYQVGQLGPFRFNGEAKDWWIHLTEPERQLFSFHWGQLFGALQNHFITPHWRSRQVILFDAMRFRQPGHEKETPIQFFQRRISKNSFLNPVNVFNPADLALAVARVVYSQPAEWNSTINQTTCPTIAQLLDKAKNEAAALMAVWELHEDIRKRNHNGLSTGHRRFFKRANTGEVFEAMDHSHDCEPGSGVHEQAAVAFAADRRQNATTTSKPDYPAGRTIDGYSYARDDSRVSARPPKRGSCFICTSPKHFMRDCPHFRHWQARREANLLERDISPEEWNEEEREYLALLVELNPGSLYTSDPERTSQVVHVVEAFFSTALQAHAQVVPRHRNARRAEALSKSPGWKGQGKQAERSGLDALPRYLRRRHAASAGPVIKEATKYRELPAGMGSLGSQASHTKVRIGSFDAEEVHGRLDSGADITLMSEEFWASLPDRPKPREGAQMRLYHLTGVAKILGYVRTKLFMTDVNGQVISFELEAYVVKDMRVPLLLGKDFQTAYEIGVQRQADGECLLNIGSSGHQVRASSSQAYDLGFDARTARVAVKDTPPKRSPARAPRVGDLRRAKKAARKAEHAQSERLVTAARDVLLGAESVHLVPVSANFEGRAEWFVEKVIISTDDGSVVAAPSAFISVEKPVLPIANPNKRPWFIRAGEVVGKLRDPAVYVDKATSPEQEEKLAASAEAIKRVIEATASVEHGSSSMAPPPPPAEDLDADVMEAVNLGPDIPEHIRPGLEEVLRKNERAFGIGGRLGVTTEKATIPLKPGAQPVSLPMYAASPAKREAIDQQMDVWFERRVIEPSNSPWAAPCVVVFRNGKARLAVDYRRLNALTVADEFPIPRQSEIVQALSGAQVLSSFDALAGFNQVEMDDDDKEKTAFRSHRGLWQFRRMPFGLRNGPSIFQRIMQTALAPFLWLFALVYIAKRA